MSSFLSPRIEKQLLKEASKNNGSIFSKKYQKIISGTSAKNTTRNTQDFSFITKIEKIDDFSYLITVLGKHLSVNSINSLSFRGKLKYKNSLKKAFADAQLIYRNVFPRRTFSFVNVFPTVYLKRHRDDDGNAATLKIIRDNIIRAGFAIDDSREYYCEHKPLEKISKEWRIEILLKGEL